MMVYNLGREQFFHENHRFATVATAAATSAADTDADVAAGVAIVTAAQA